MKKKAFECYNAELKIRGYILFPKKKEASNKTVILSHGFASSTDQLRKYARDFAKAGCVVFYYDFCGSGRGKSDGDSTKMSVLTEKSDLIAVLDYVRSFDFVDKENVILAGCSQGGFVSALVAAERESDVSKLVLFYPALCIPDDARRGSILGTTFNPEKIPETFKAIFIKLGGVYIRDAASLDPYNEICTFKKPVIIIHGDNDKIVDVSYAVTANEKYPDSKLVVINKGDHGFIFHGYKQAIKEAIEFIK